MTRTWTGSTTRWSAGASVWRSLWDNRQPYAEEADWLSSGAELSFSFYGDRWDVSGTAGVGRYLNQEEVTRSAEFNLQGSLTHTRQPLGRLPRGCLHYERRNHTLDSLGVTNLS